MTAVVHVITGLQVGGAELALWRLLRATDPDRVSASVISLTRGGDIAPRIRKLGVPVHDIGLTSARDLPVAVTRLRRVLTGTAPDVVQTWMHHADLIGGLAAWSSGVPAVWGLRMGALSAERASTRAVAALNARLSRRLPAAVVACASSVADEYVARGYPSRLMCVIPNGYGAPLTDPAAGSALRARLGIPEEAVVVGRVGRWHAMKDYPSLLAAAEGVLTRRPDVHLVLVGEGVEPGNAELQQLVSRLPGSRQVHLLGAVQDMAAVYSSLDVLCSSSSSGEGFPNVIAEAMLAAVPVVSTDVGESATIVGDTGRVVPPARPDVLGRALDDVVALSVAERRALASRARDRIVDHYGVDRMAAAFADLHERVAARRAPSAR